MTPLLAASVTGHIHIVEYLIAKYDLVSRQERIDALELLGATFVDKKRDMLGSFKLWRRAMEERYEKVFIYTFKSEIELERHGINFLSVQDLILFHRKNQGKLIETSSTESENRNHSMKLNVYQLVAYFMEHNQKGYYFLDEVPLIRKDKNERGMLNISIYLSIYIYIIFILYLLK